MSREVPLPKHCRPRNPSISDQAIDKVTSRLMLPCKFASTGCLLTLHRAAKLEHEKLCQFRPKSCLCVRTSCKWKGCLDAVIPHLKERHKSIMTLHGKDLLFLAADINVEGPVDWVMVQFCFNFHFLLVLEKHEKQRGHQQYFAIVLLIGTPKQANNFAYRLELTGRCRRRLAWEATPHSILDGVASAITKRDCLMFDKATANLFAEDGNLTIQVSICSS